MTQTKQKQTTPIFKPGDKVKLTGKFLRNTGQFAGGEGQSVWTVRGCDCAECAKTKRITGMDLVVTDQEKTEADLKAYYTAEELEKQPCLRYRRINAANLMLAAKPDYS